MGYEPVCIGDSPSLLHGTLLEVAPWEFLLGTVPLKRVILQGPSPTDRNIVFFLAW